MIQMRKLALSLSGLGLLLAGCGGVPAVADAPGATRIDGIERYFPLADGMVYTYEVTREPIGVGDRVLIKVRRSTPQHATLLTGSRTRALTIQLGSIQRDGAGYVLREPLSVGAQWPGENGGKTRVVDINARVTVPAGTFSGCVKTVEDVGAEGESRVESVFCPDVGIAQLVVHESHGSSTAVQRFQLLTYGPPVDLSTIR